MNEQQALQNVNKSTADRVSTGAMYFVVVREILEMQDFKDII